MRWRSGRRVRRGAAVVVATATALTACSGAQQVPEEELDKSVEMTAQTNPEAVLDRTRGLPAEADYLWYSGTTGSRAPGPSTFWLDVRVIVPEPDLAQMRAQCQSQTPTDPEVVDELAQQLGPGPYNECPEIAATTAAEGWQVRAWLTDDDPVLVVSMIGEG